MPTEPLMTEQRLKAAQIITDGLNNMENPSERFAVMALVIANLLDGTVGGDELRARSEVDAIGRAVMHIWGAANDVDISIEQHPEFPEGSTGA